MTVSILRSGFLTTVQDLGRTNHRRFGVSLAGALDPHAMRVANVLVGNDESLAGIEATLGNVRLRFNDRRLVAWCGGDFAVRIGATDIPSGRVALVEAGEELFLLAPEAGARAWLAISGGVDVPAVLGSRSTDLRAAFGGLDGHSLRDGDVLSLGPLPELSLQLAQCLNHDRVATWAAPSEWSSFAVRPRFLRIVHGTDWKRFDEESRTALTAQPFVVSAESDRMGARLTGPILRSSNGNDSISEGVAPGALQVPSDGQPILLLGDCQSIGGYPKIAHVITVDLPMTAQLRPAEPVRFLEVSLADAHQLLWERSSDFARFKIGLNLQSR